MNTIRDLLASRELLANLVRREVSGQYKRTALGRLWSLVNPIAAMLVYTFIFSFVFRLQPDPGDPSGLNVFPLWLMAGLLPWLFFSSATQGAMGSLISNAGLITKVYFPRSVLPAASVGALAVNWCFEMAVLVAAFVIVGGWGVLVWVPLVLVAMVVLALFSFGLGMILSIANVHFRDTQHFAAILFQFWMYLTPVIYPASLVKTVSGETGPLLGTPLTLADIYTWNPMYSFVQVFRELLYDQRLPDPAAVITCLVWTIIALTVGMLVFGRSEKKVAELL